MTKKSDHFYYLVELVVTFDNLKNKDLTLPNEKSL